MTYPINRTRERLMLEIERHPGLHLRELARRCGISASTAADHLRILEASASAHSVRLDRTIHWFPTSVPVDRAASLVALQEPRRRRILRAIAARPGVTHKDLCKTLSRIPSTTVSEHVSWLARHGVVKRTRCARRIQLFAVKAPAAPNARASRSRQSERVPPSAGEAASLGGAA